MASKSNIKSILSELVLISEGIDVDYKRVKNMSTIQQDRYKDDYGFLFDDTNAAKKLNEYLQTSSNFINFQTCADLLPCYWLLFTILDPSDDEQPIKYLYGPTTKQDQYTASFLFRSLYDKDGKIKDEYKIIMHQLGSVSSVIRHKSQTKEATMDLSSLQDEIVYIPGIAIDYHILKWCFDYLKEKNVDYMNRPFPFFPEDRYKQLGVDPGFYKGFEGKKHRCLTMMEWFEIWGFIIKVGQKYSWSKRGKSLLLALEIGAADISENIRRLVADITSTSRFTDMGNSFQKEIHYIYRFRRNITQPQGILRFSHPDFKYKNRYVIYLNAVVKEELAPGLNITQTNIRDKSHPVGKRLQAVLLVYKILMSIEFKRVYIDQLLPKYEEKIIQNSRKSAISQITLRNGSHNIGSHVLSRLVTRQSIELLKDELNAKKHFNRQYEPLATLPQNNLKIYNVNDYIAYSYSYLKTRMDFLADLATSTPTLENSKLFIQDLIAGFDKNRILLNRISGTDEFNYRLEIRDWDGLEQNGDINNCPLFDTDSDKVIAVVNDLLGQHAFYVILENIIRNTAKHANVEKDAEVVFTIGFRESLIDKSLYELVIYDNCYLSEKRVSELVYEQNHRLNENILKEDNTLRNGNWGLIEMDISAAYLRKINVEDVDKPQFDIPLGSAPDAADLDADISRKPLILQALKVKNHLGYKLFLPKPKEILILDNDGKIWSSIFVKDGLLLGSELKSLESAGILFLHNSDTIMDKDWKIQENLSYSHHILLELCSRNVLDCNYLPQRVINMDMLKVSMKEYADNRNEIKDYSDPALEGLLKSPSVLIEESWRCWISKKMRINNITEISPFHLYSEFINYKPDTKSVFGIALDDHGNDMKDVLKTFQSGQNHFYQDYNHLSKPVMDKIRGPEYFGSPGSVVDLQPLFKFIDGALTNVLILDERIQQYFNNKHQKNKIKKIGAIAENRLIYCPSGNWINLSAQSYPEKSLACLTGYLEKIASKNKKIKTIDISIIHIGVIEKFLKCHRKDKKKEDIEGFLEELQSIFKEKFGKKTFLIITSGRGKPDNLPDKVPFLGYSILSQYVIETQFKSHLVEALLSARPKI